MFACAVILSRYRCQPLGCIAQLWSTDWTRFIRIDAYRERRHWNKWTSSGNIFATWPMSGSLFLLLVHASRHWLHCSTRMPRGSLLLGQRQEMPTGDLRTCRLTSKSLPAGSRREFGERPEKIGSDSSEYPLSQAFSTHAASVVCLSPLRASLIFFTILYMICLRYVASIVLPKAKTMNETNIKKVKSKKGTSFHNANLPQIHCAQAWLRNMQNHEYARATCDFKTQNETLNWVTSFLEFTATGSSVQWCSVIFIDISWMMNTLIRSLTETRPAGIMVQVKNPDVSFREYAQRKNSENSFGCQWNFAKNADDNLLWILWLSCLMMRVRRLWKHFMTSQIKCSTGSAASKILVTSIQLSVYNLYILIITFVHYIITHIYIYHYISIEWVYWQFPALLSLLHLQALILVCCIL